MKKQETTADLSVNESSSHIAASFSVRCTAKKER